MSLNPSVAATGNQKWFYVAGVLPPELTRGAGASGIAFVTISPPPDCGDPGLRKEIGNNLAVSGAVFPPLYAAIRA